jgi:putative aldouronate transport system permease protein
MITDLTLLEGASRTRLTPESLKAAAVVFATVPILLVYPWLQKYFVSGAMQGAIKG